MATEPLSTEPTTPARRSRRRGPAAGEAPAQLALALEAPAQDVEALVIPAAAVIAIAEAAAPPETVVTAQEPPAKAKRTRAAKKTPTVPATLETAPAEVSASATDEAAETLSPARKRAVLRKVEPPAVGIRKSLEKIEAITGWRFREIFSDWTEIALYTLEQQIRHDYARAIWGTVAQDPPGIAEFFRRMQSKYAGYNGEGKESRWPDVSGFFAEALAHLCRAYDDDDYQDILGPLFMEYGSPDAGLGQFYTPACIADLLDRLIGAPTRTELEAADPGYAAFVGRSEGLQQLVREAMLQAMRADAGCAADFEAVVARGLAGDALDQVVLAEIMPRCMQEHYQPPHLYEPCVGAGVMVLEAVKDMPRWMRVGTFFTLTAIDLSPIAYRMAKLQILLTGVGGYEYCRELARRGDPACLRWRGLDVRCGNSLAKPAPPWETPEGYGPDAVILPVMSTPELAARVARITERMSPGALGPGGRRLVEEYDQGNELAKVIDLATVRATQAAHQATEEAA